jgi:hypothetical protein
MKPLFIPSKTKTIGVPEDESTVFRSVKKSLGKWWTTSNGWDKIFWVVFITLIVWAIMSGLFGWQWAETINEFLFGSEGAQRENSWQSPGN